jgi:hypothetical protein
VYKAHDEDQSIFASRKTDPPPEGREVGRRKRKATTVGEGSVVLRGQVAEIW